MIEAFYSGTAGLTAHQNSLDVIANNIANVNTNGYKTKVQNFSSLLSASEVRPETANSANLIAGSGTAVSSVATDMSEGTLDETGRKTDYYISSNGFFAVRDNTGNTYYTRDGAFQEMPGANGRVLGTADGMTVLDAGGNPVTVNPSGAAATTPGVYTFLNAPGLLSIGGNLFEATNVSGTAAASAVTPVQGTLERSNVDVAEQMTGLITSQRGYQFSSSLVSTANQIENMINELGQS